MQVFTRVFLLSVCVLSAYAVPRLAQRAVAVHDSQAGLYRVFLAQMRSAVIDTRALAPSSVACANNYNNATKKIVDTLTNKTDVCESAANTTTVANNRSANATVSSVRGYQLQIQRNIQACLNETDNSLFLNCTQANFDGNLQLLDTSNSLSYQVLSELSVNGSVVNNQRDNCISSAVNDAKIQSIQAANDYNQCLRLAKYQRDQIALPAAAVAQQADSAVAASTPHNGEPVVPIQSTIALQYSADDESAESAVGAASVGGSSAGAAGETFASAIVGQQAAVIA